MVIVTILEPPKGVFWSFFCNKHGCWIIYGDFFPFLLLFVAFVFFFFVCFVLCVLLVCLWCFSSAFIGCWVERLFLGTFGQQW